MRKRIYDCKKILDRVETKNYTIDIWDSTEEYHNNINGLYIGKTAGVIITNNFSNEIEITLPFLKRGINGSFKKSLLKELSDGYNKELYNEISECDKI